MTDTAFSPLILESLKAVTRAQPISRKVLVAPDLNYARELLVTLGRETGGWIGWEPATLRHIADALAFVALHAKGRRIAGDLEIRSLANRALERATSTGSVRRLAALAGSPGLRQTLHDSVLELRMAGVGASELLAQTHADSSAHEVAAVLREYEVLLQASSVADPAHVFRAALDSFDDEFPYVLSGSHIVLAPSLLRYGLPGELLGQLLAHGAQPLRADLPVDVCAPQHLIASQLSDAESAVASLTHGSSQLAWLGSRGIPPRDTSSSPAAVVQTDIFSAATPSDELREVLRRVLAEGVRWDDVEIVTTDPDTYGIAFEALCQNLGIGGTMLHGVPLVRTRLGRALQRWFTWLQDGLPSDVLRQALEAGELATHQDAPATAVARELRALQIGWGRNRYEAALRTLESGVRIAQLDRRDGESEEEYAVRASERLQAERAITQLLRTLLEATPAVPERGSHKQVRTSPAALAEATEIWLSLVPIHGVAESETLERIRSRLRELALESVESGFPSALATLRDALSDVRAWPLLTGERSPWSCASGALHLTDTAHAGTTGRRRTFVVGLDAERTSGSRRSDPLLPDSLRQSVTGGRLSTGAQRREENAYLLLASLASIRGRVTLSYAASGTLDGREAGPSPILLQAWRLQQGDASLSYEQLRAQLTPPVSAVPLRGVAELLDARDVWLDAIADGPLLLDGEELVRSAFPRFDTGLSAAALLAGDSLTPYQGLVERAAGAFDPTTDSSRAISPSGLEQLARCPLSWFYHYGLSIRLPQDPEYDPERWLDAAARGSLLHEIFESFTRTYQHRQHDLSDGAAYDYALRLADTVAARWRVAVPPPSEIVYESELAEIRDATLTFLMMERRAIERGDAGRWHEFEYTFGDSQRPCRYPLDDGTTLAVRGRIDRIDLLDDASLLVIDYKTGRPGPYGKGGKAAFDGGRRLQPALYSAVLEELLGVSVARFEYRFPTERGDSEIIAYNSDELHRARPIVTQLLKYVRDGTFVPTTDETDCGYCDYQAICRVKHGDFGKVSSPRAAWAKSHAEHTAAYDVMLALRGDEVEG